MSSWLATSASVTRSAGPFSRAETRPYAPILLVLAGIAGALVWRTNAVSIDQIAIIGKPGVYDPVPWFWSDQFELKLQMCGLSDGYDAAETNGDVAAAKFSVQYRKGGRLIAVDAVNDARAHMLSRRRIAEETNA